MNLDVDKIYICCSQKKSSEFPDLIESLKSELGLEDIKEFDPDKKSSILLFGGDGSINYLINLVKDFSNTKVLYIPCGTANDFAKSLKLSVLNPSVESIKDILINAPIINIPLMKCNDKYFINAVTAGAPADVTNSGSDLLKKVTGKLSYYLNSVETALNLEPINFSLILNGEKIDFNSYGFVVSQGLFTGGGIKSNTSICPNFNNFFEFLTLNETSMSVCLKSILRLQSDDFIYDPNDQVIFRSRINDEIRINSDDSIKMKLDGEEYESKSILFKKSTNNIKFYVF